MLFKTRPRIIEAVCFTGDNVEEVLDLVGARKADYDPDYFVPNFVEASEYWPSWDIPHGVTHLVFDEAIHQAWLPVRPGDYIVKGAQGEFTPCEADIFFAIYESLANNYNDHPPLS